MTSFDIRIKPQNFCAWMISNTRNEHNRLPPMPIGRRKRDKNLPFGVASNVGEEEMALALLRAALAKRNQAAQAAISFSVCWEAEKTWGVLKIEPRTDNETQPRILRRNVCAHDAGKRVAIRNCDGRKPQRLRLCDQFLAVRGAAQKREVGGDLKFGVLHLTLQFSARLAMSNPPRHGREGGHPRQISKLRCKRCRIIPAHRKNPAR